MAAVPEIVARRPPAMAIAPCALLLCSAAAPGAVLVYALWPPIDLSLLISCLAVWTVVVAVLAVARGVHAVIARRRGAVQADAAVSALMELAQDPNVPLGPLM